MYTHKRDSQNEILVCQMRAENGREYDAASYVQLNVFYNINNFFGFLTKSGIKMIKKLPEKNEERMRLFFEGRKFEINENRISHFFSGAYEANSYRKEYVKIVNSDVISEVKRAYKVCKMLFDIENIDCSYLVKCVVKYLKEERYIFLQRNSCSMM